MLMVIIKYICHARDHFTRFSWAKSLTSKRAVEVAAFLFDLFFSIGSPPSILQSNNGKEFCAAIIKDYQRETSPSTIPGFNRKRKWHFAAKIREMDGELRKKRMVIWTSFANLIDNSVHLQII